MAVAVEDSGEGAGGTGMTEYINRESAAKALMTHRGLTPIARLEAATTVCHVPAADVKPNIKGYWVKTGQSFIYPDKFICYSCSECGYDIEKTKFNYCPNCGVDMREG